MRSPTRLLPPAGPATISLEDPADYTMVNRLVEPDSCQKID